MTERVVTQEGALTERRAPLNRARVLRAAVDVADRGGIESLSMRKLGQELGVDAMALYRHVRDKDDLLDGVVEVVVGEIERPQPGAKWKPALREHVMAARQVMLRHRGLRASSRNGERRVPPPWPTSTPSWRPCSPAGSRWTWPITRSTP